MGHSTEPKRPSGRRNWVVNQIHDSLHDRICECGIIADPLARLNRTRLDDRHCRRPEQFSGFSWRAP